MCMFRVEWSLGVAILLTFACPSSPLHISETLSSPRLALHRHERGVEFSFEPTQNLQLGPCGEEGRAGDTSFSEERFGLCISWHGPIAQANMNREEESAVREVWHASVVRLRGGAPSKAVRESVEPARARERMLFRRHLESKRLEISGTPMETIDMIIYIVWFSTVMKVFSKLMPRFSKNFRPGYFVKHGPFGNLVLSALLSVFMLGCFGLVATVSGILSQHTKRIAMNLLRGMWDDGSGIDPLLRDPLKVKGGSDPVTQEYIEKHGPQAAQAYGQYERIVQARQPAETKKKRSMFGPLNEFSDDDMYERSEQQESKRVEGRSGLR